MVLSPAWMIRALGLLMAVLWVLLLSFTLPLQETVQPGQESLGFSWHAFLIATQDPMYPLNIQVLMWLCFFMCLAEVFVKWFALQEQRRAMQAFSLYHNPSQVTLEHHGQHYQIQLDPNEAIKPELLAAIYLAKKPQLQPGSLIAEFFKKINFQFHSTNSVADVYSAVTTSMELSLHQVDLRYTVLRYLAWLIPTLGFIGTVIGIAMALGKAGVMKADDPNLLAVVVPQLAVAFYTTLLALLLSAVVMILIQMVQAQDEASVADVGRLCLDDIIINLKPRSGQ